MPPNKTIPQQASKSNLLQTSLTRRTFLLQGLSSALSLGLAACAPRVSHAPVPTNELAPEPTQAASEKAFGINISGAEYRGDIKTQYTDPNDLDYYASNGLKIFRLNISWELLQPRLNMSLDRSYLGWIRSMVDHAADQGSMIIIDPHNYDRYNGEVIGSRDVPVNVFTNFWKGVSEVFKGHHVILG